MESNEWDLRDKITTRKMTCSETKGLVNSSAISETFLANNNNDNTTVFLFSKFVGSCFTA